MRCTGLGLTIGDHISTFKHLRRFIDAVVERCLGRCWLQRLCTTNPETTFTCGAVPQSGEHDVPSRHHELPYPGGASVSDPSELIDHENTDDPRRAAIADLERIGS